MTGWIIVIALTLALFVATFVAGERLARKKSDGRTTKDLMNSSTPEECES